jgi:hypothetical protein
MERFRTFLLVVLFTTFSQGVFSQEKPQSLIKAGYFPYFWSDPMPWVFSFEYERNIKNASYLTYGLGYDIIHIETNFHMIHLNLKFYPFFWKYDKKLFRGLYLGIAPMFSIDTYPNIENKYGFGFIPSLGTQFLIKERLSISCDINYYQYENFIDDNSYYFVSHAYRDLFITLKFGILLGRNK